MRVLPCVLVSVSCLAAGAALADPMPKMVPEHDLSGTYLLTTPKEGTRSFSVEYSKSADIVRFNLPGASSYILYDLAAKDAKTVIPRMKSYFDQPSVAARAQALQAGGGTGEGATVVGSKSIAGHECTNYKVTNPSKGTWSTFCTTADGVILEIANSDSTHAIAQTVSYDTVPAADVQVPPDYTQVMIPQMPEGMGQGGMMGAYPGGVPSVPNPPQQ